MKNKSALRSGSVKIVLNLRFKLEKAQLKIGDLCNYPYNKCLSLIWFILTWKIFFHAFIILVTLQISLKTPWGHDEAEVLLSVPVVWDKKTQHLSCRVEII